MQPQDLDEANNWLDRPTEVKLTLEKPLKTGFMLGLGFAFANLIFFALFCGLSAALFGAMVTSFLNSGQQRIQQELTQPDVFDEGTQSYP
jgi:hypothetical protein